MLQFVAGRTPIRAQHAYFRKWGPFWCIFFGMICLMMDLTRHLINDDYGNAPMTINGVHTAYWWGMTIFGTWIGALLLLTGILWDTKLLQKVGTAWRRVRSGR